VFCPQQLTDRSGCWGLAIALVRPVLSLQASEKGLALLVNPCGKRMPYLPHCFITLLFRHILSDHFTGRKLNVHSGISHSDKNVVQAHKESAKKKQPRWHNSNLARVEGDSIVRHFILIEHDFVKEDNWIRAFQELERYGLVGGFKGRGFRMHGSLIVCAIRPVEGLDDFCDTLVFFFSASS